MKYLYRRNASALKSLQQQDQMLITFDKPYVPINGYYVDLQKSLTDNLGLIVGKLLNLEDIYWGHHVAIFVDFKRNEGDEIYDKKWWTRGFTLAYDPFELGEKQYKDLSEIYNLRVTWDQCFCSYLPKPNPSMMLTEKTEILEV